MNELNTEILGRIQDTEFAQVISGYEVDFFEAMKAFALDVLHDSSIQNLLFEEEGEIEEVVLESEASKRQDIGEKYWNAYFVPELGVIIQVTAINEQDAESTKDAYVKTQLEKQNDH